MCGQRGGHEGVCWAVGANMCPRTVLSSSLALWFLPSSSSRAERGGLWTLLAQPSSVSQRRDGASVSISKYPRTVLTLVGILLNLSPGHWETHLLLDEEGLDTCRLAGRKPGRL